MEQTMTFGREDDQTKWSRRIQALLAHAANSANTEQARQAYAAKAAHLMTRYGIEQVQQRNAEGDTRPESARVWGYAVSGVAGLGHARCQAAALVAEAMGCKVLIHNFPNPRPCTVMITGVDSDITALKTLLPLVGRQAELAAATAAARGSRAPSYLSGFLVGYARAVAERIAARRHDYAAEGSGAELVLASRDRLVADLYEATFGHLTTAPQPVRQRADGHAAGKAAGRSADLGDARLGDPQRPSLPGN
jgi:hypothetical protein